MFTLEELKEKILKLYDPDDLIEALGITAEELLDRFDDKLLMCAHEKFKDEIEELEYDY